MPVPNPSLQRTTGLAFDPQQYLSGLYKITLTNSDNLRSSYRGKFWSEKRRLRPADCGGLYHKGHILLAMDLILQGCPEVFLLFPPIKTFLIGEVLYHEMGHHIHRIEEPGYRADKERGGGGVEREVNALISQATLLVPR